MSIPRPLRSLPSLALAVVLVQGLLGCPSPKSPTGPPPEYEDPPPPSWLDAGVPGLDAGPPGPPGPPASTPAATPATAPLGDG